MDYRRIAAYQMMLCRCTAGRDYDVHTYPHREFFGALSGMYAVRDWSNDAVYGHVSLAQMRQPGFAHAHVPSRLDIETVLSYLSTNALPTELGLTILEFANYEPNCLSIVPDDPLHVENAVQLRKYLGYCWRLLVRCDILAKACGKRVDWVGETTQCIFHLFGVKYPKMFNYGAEEEANEGFRIWKGNEIERCWIKFA
ncbi:hypothetical protein ACJ72_03570 [Emergomyces africanus]|uniref:Uncharacterized protein n=1 Tax=Emergomyces africanus TaxID=1955775 RepID=A0A1B7NZA9_9EURO|nr:hypothetical protein ACJ72_03570 [Emergomyces africanus]